MLDFVHQSGVDGLACGFVATERSTATSTALSVLASTMGRSKAVVAATSAPTIIAAGLTNDPLRPWSRPWSGACGVVLRSDISLCPTTSLRLMTDSNAIVKECEKIPIYGHPRATPEQPPPEPFVLLVLIPRFAFKTSPKWVFGKLLGRTRKMLECSGRMRSA